MGLVLLPYYVLVALGVSLGYHRGMAHNAVIFRPWLRRTLIWLGLPAGPPVVWAGTHRFHHLHTDDAEDPHSPVQSGFWYAHCGWYLQERRLGPTVLYALAGPWRLVYDAVWRPLDPRGLGRWAADVAADPWVRFMSTRLGFCLAALPHLAPNLVAWRVAGWKGVLATHLLQVLLYNAGDAIDSVAHLYGDRPCRDGTGAARNLRWLAVLTMGDGWHNNHHAAPYSARHGWRPGEWDPGWWVIQWLQRRGQVVAVRLPPPEIMPTASSSL